MRRCFKHDWWEYEFVSGGWWYWVKQCRKCFKVKECWQTDKEENSGTVSG